MGGCTGSIRSKNTTGSADPVKRTSFENLPAPDRPHPKSAQRPSCNPERISQGSMPGKARRTSPNRTDDYRPILGVGFFVCFFRSSVILFKYRVEQG
jgi:hypothetical protein